jgi:hypothetical protein
MSEETDNRFKVVFDALDEAAAESAAADAESDVVAVQLLADELDEIARLREIVLETTPPELSLFTST